jgi:hypothetical protein
MGVALSTGRHVGGADGHDTASVLNGDIVLSQIKSPIAELDDAAPLPNAAIAVAPVINFARYTIGDDAKQTVFTLTSPATVTLSAKTATDIMRYMSDATARIHESGNDAPTSSTRSATNSAIDTTTAEIARIAGMLRSEAVSNVSVDAIDAPRLRGMCVRYCVSLVRHMGITSASILAVVDALTVCGCAPHDRLWEAEIWQHWLQPKTVEFAGFVMTCVWALCMEKHITTGDYDAIVALVNVIASRPEAMKTAALLHWPLHYLVTCALYTRRIDIAMYLCMIFAPMSHGTAAIRAATQCISVDVLTGMTIDQFRKEHARIVSEIPVDAALSAHVINVVGAGFPAWPFISDARLVGAESGGVLFRAIMNGRPDIATYLITQTPHVLFDLSYPSGLNIYQVTMVMSCIANVGIESTSRFPHRCADEMCAVLDAWSAPDAQGQHDMRSAGHARAVSGPPTSARLVGVSMAWLYVFLRLSYRINPLNAGVVMKSMSSFPTNRISWGVAYVVEMAMRARPLVSTAVYRRTDKMCEEAKAVMAIVAEKSDTRPTWVHPDVWTGWNSQKLLKQQMHGQIDSAADTPGGAADTTQTTTNAAAVSLFNSQETRKALAMSTGYTRRVVNAVVSSVCSPDVLDVCLYTARAKAMYRSRPVTDTGHSVSGPPPGPSAAQSDTATSNADASEGDQKDHSAESAHMFM